MDDAQTYFDRICLRVYFVYRINKFAGCNMVREEQEYVKSASIGMHYSEK